MTTSGRVVLLLLAYLHVTSVDAARVLGIFIHPGRSHFESFHPVMNGLAEKGHDVTVLSYFGNSSSHPNYKEILIDGAPEGFAHITIGVDQLVRQTILKFFNPNTMAAHLYKNGTTSTGQAVAQSLLSKSRILESLHVGSANM